TTRPTPRSTLFPYTTLFRSCSQTDFDSSIDIKYCDSIRILSDRGAKQRALQMCPRCECVLFLWSMSCGSHHDVHWATGRSSAVRSEEHTSELQSRFDLVCRL